MCSSEVVGIVVHFKNIIIKCDEDEWVVRSKSGNRRQSRRLNHQVRDQSSAQ